MKRIFSWAEWSIATKILVTFLGLAIISLGITWYISLENLQNLGNYALESSHSLGENAIRLSTSHLVKQGEDTISQISKDVAKQVEIYLSSKPPMTLADMRNDPELRQIVVQPVGTTGYTTLIDPEDTMIIIHRFPEQEKNLSPLENTLPHFWSLLESTRGPRANSGYYDWQEVDGRITQKYAGITPVNISYDGSLTIWATTYIDEFSKPVEETAREINNAILESTYYINKNVSDMRDLFVVISTAIILVVVGMAYLLSWVITNPILALKRGADTIGQGNLEYRLKFKTKDELGKLANSFNKMSSDLKSYMEDNIAKERTIQENLRLYARQVSQAQEVERKRIARELHDDTAQALVVIARHLDDLEAGINTRSIQEVRKEVQKVLEGVRRFSQELRPSVLDDLGLIPAVKWLASEVTKNYRIQVQTEINGEQIPLPPETELALFRIVQEALNNVSKHSDATTVTVKIEYLLHSVKFTVTDNGKGFEVPHRVGDLTREGKLGLTGMEERAQLLRGTLVIQSQAGTGTILTVEIPV